mmetsp:Transcript_21150/g.41132  ORF Transcript_21150/g.41132 Transcript_21150/m.41132 type:complete len:340 (-) Transcript_21150:903-1922(-)
MPAAEASLAAPLGAKGALGAWRADAWARGVGVGAWAAGVAQRGLGVGDVALGAYKALGCPPLLGSLDNDRSELHAVLPSVRRLLDGVFVHPAVLPLLVKHPSDDVLARFNRGGEGDGLLGVLLPRLLRLNAPDMLLINVQLKVVCRVAAHAVEGKLHLPLVLNIDLKRHPDICNRAIPHPCIQHIAHGPPPARPAEAVGAPRAHLPLCDQLVKLLLLKDVIVVPNLACDGPRRALCAHLAAFKRLIAVEGACWAVVALGTFPVRPGRARRTVDLGSGRKALAPRADLGLRVRVGAGALAPRAGRVRHLYVSIPAALGGLASRAAGVRELGARAGSARGA